MTSDDLEAPISDEERRSAIRLHKRLVWFEQISRRILANPETTHERRRRAEGLLRETLAARALWATGERPDARMGDLERIAHVLDFLTLLPLAKRGALLGQGRTDDATRAIVALATEFPHEKPRVLWGRLAERLGWRRDDQGKLITAELHAPDGFVLTYRNFEKRLDRARAGLKGKPKK